MSNILVKCERVIVKYPRINVDRGFFYGQAQVQGSKASFKLQSWDRDVVNQIDGVMGNLENGEEVNIIGGLKPTKHQVKEVSSGHMKQATDQNGNDVWTMAIDIKKLKLANPNANKVSIEEVNASLAKFDEPAPKGMPVVEFDTPPTTSKKTDGIDYNDIPWEM